jgi:hypothetical protein
VHHGPRPIAPCTALLAQAAGHTMCFDTFPLDHKGDSAFGTQMRSDDDQVGMRQDGGGNGVARYDNIFDASGQYYLLDGGWCSRSSSYHGPLTVMLFR